MGLFQRILNALPRRNVTTAVVGRWQENRPLPIKYDIARFNDEGYRRNVVIHACINEIATSLAEPPVYACRIVDVKTGDKEPLPYNHMLNTLLRRPSRKVATEDFIQILSTNLSVAGNAYVYKERNSLGMPIALKILRPDLIRVIPRGGEVVGYEFGLDEGMKETLPPEDVIHFFENHDPLDPWYGLSPIMVLARIGDLDNNAVDYLSAYFLNGGAPAGILKHKTQRLPKTERERIKELYRETYGTMKSWHDVMVLDEDVDYQEIGSEPRRLDLSSIFGETESRMCAAFGVPPIIVGVKIGLTSATYSNYGQARTSFYQEKISPSWRKIQNRLSIELAQDEISEEFYVEIDTDDVDELQEDKEKVWNRYLKGWDSGAVKRKEFRAAVGLPIDEDDDDVYKLGTSDVLSSDLDEGLTAEETEPVTEEEEEEQTSLPISETQGRRSPPWRVIQGIADNATPEVKKKF